MPQSSSSEEGKRPRRRARRRLIAAALVVVLLLGGWFVFEHYVLRIDRYRVMAEDAIAEATGLPTKLGKLDLILLPAPHIKVFNAAVGEDDFRAVVDEITIEADLGSAIGRNLRVSDVALLGVSVWLPEDAEVLDEKVRALVEKLSEPSETEPFVTEVARVHTDLKKGPVKIYRGERAQLAGDVTFTLNQILSDSPTMKFEASTHEEIWYGLDEGRINLSLNIGRDTEGAINNLEGSANLRMDNLATLAVSGVPEMSLSTKADITGQSLETISASIAGETEGLTQQALDGEFTTTVWWDQGVLTANEIEWNAPGLQARGDLTRHKDGAIACRIVSAAVSGQVLDAIIQSASANEFRVYGEESASVSAEDVLVGFEPGQSVRLVEGNVTFNGVALETSGGDRVTSGVTGRLEIVEGVLHLKEMKGEGFTLAGQIHPDPEIRTLRLDLHGSADLATARLGVFLPGDTVHDVTGSVELKRIAGTFSEDAGLPDDLVVEGSLADGAFDVAAADFAGRFQSVRADFTTGAEGVRVMASGASEQLGKLTADGRYGYADHQWTGTVSFHVPTVVYAFVEGEERREQIGPFLTPYSDSTFDTTITLPSESAKGIQVRATRQGSPPVEAAVAFDRVSEEFVLGAIDASTRLQLADVRAGLPEGVRGEGEADISFYRIASDESFGARADLTGCTVQSGDRIRKNSGDELVVTVTGQASRDLWDARSAVVNCVGVEVPFAIQESRLLAENLDLPVERLARLVRGEVSAGGRVRGMLAVNPVEADVTLQDVAMTIDGKETVRSIDGRVHYRDGLVTAQDLRVVGADSDFVVNASQQEGVWRGTVQGQKFNVDQALAAYETVESLPAGDDGENGGDAGSEVVRAEFDVDLSEVHYRRGRINQVKAAIHSDDAGIHARNVSFIPYTGRATGTVDLLPMEDGRDMLDVKLSLDSVSSRILDEIAFEQPRGFHGLVSGNVDFQAPFIEPKEMMKESNGTIQWAARDGSFGQLGFATKLLAVLRTTEIFALKLPSAKDEGLIYDNCYGTLELTDGVGTLKDVSLASTTYSMAAAGTIDFPKDSTQVVVKARLLESVNTLIERVPVVGDALGVTGDLATVTVRVTGSPYETSFALSGVGGEAGKPLKKGEEAIKDITDAASKALKKLFNP